MMFSKNSQIGWFLFAIVALSLHTKITSGQINVCWMDGDTRVATNFHSVPGYGRQEKCTAVLRECDELCKRQGRITTSSVCQWYIYQPLYACSGCCGIAPPPPSPPPPSPPPPPPSPPPPSPSPPSPRDPRDQCSKYDISLSREETSCSACTTANCDRKCAAIGEAFVSGGCNRYNFFCSCCCTNSKPPPSPPPPSPPPPSPIDPRDQCSKSDISLSRQEKSCSTCTTDNCDTKCAAIGEALVSAGCNRYNFFCNCCCTSSDLSSATRTRSPRSSLFNAA